MTSASCRSASTRPTAAATVTPSGTIALSGADALSGLATLEYALDGGAWTSYTGPVEVTAAVSIALTQDIGATDRLRTGGCGKTLTFTLSTTTP